MSANYVPKITKKHFEKESQIVKTITLRDNSCSRRSTSAAAKIKIPNVKAGQGYMLYVSCNLK